MKTSRSSAEDVTMNVTCADTGIGWILRYELFFGSEGGRSFYSVRITRTDTGESALVKDITSDVAVAKRIFDLLVKGTVTPCCAFEVVEELLELTL